MPKANAFRVAVRPVVLGACLAQLCGLASAGDQVQDLDFFILVDRSASGFFDAEIQIDAQPSLFSEIRVAEPGEPSIPLENDEPGSFDIQLPSDGSFEDFLTEDLSGFFLDIQFISTAGPVSVYRFIPSEVFGPQVDLASIPGFPAGLEITPGTPTAIEWSAPAETGDFVIVFAEGGDPSDPVFFQTASPLPFDPPVLAGLDQSLTPGATAVPLPPELEGTPVAAAVSYGVALGSFTPQLISGPALNIGNAVALALSTDEAFYEPVGCPADLAEPVGVLDLSDIVAFVSAFGSQDPAADFTADGLFDLSDIVAFVAAFNAGCP